MSRAIGYARVCTAAQDMQLQVDALAAAGCAPVFTDHASGAKSKRPGLDACMKELKADDSLVVRRLDRLGRSMQHMLGLPKELQQRGVGFGRSKTATSIPGQRRASSCFTYSRAWLGSSAA